MSTYEFHCKQCGHRFEIMMTLHDHEQHKQLKCPKCHSKKIIQQPSRFQAVTSSKA